MVNERLGSLIQYMSKVDPRAVNKLAYKYGYVPPMTEEGRQGFLIRGLKEEGDDFFKDMARYHPDRDIILNADGSTVNPREPNVIDISSQATPTAPMVSKSDNSQLVRIIIILVIAFIIYKMLS